MSTRVVFVDFAAWGAAEASQREVCGTRAFVLRGAEARAAERRAEHHAACAGLFDDGPRTAAPWGPLDGPSAPADRMLPGLAVWLATHRPGVQRT